MTIYIHCPDEETKIKIATQIHESLVGDTNYVISCMGVNMHDDEKIVMFWDDTSGSDREVNIYL